MIGETFSHYKILEKLGQGGMGEVYLARDQHLERDVAVKVLPPHTLDDPAARKRFRKEALALSKINHPNIATVFDFDSEKNVDFLAMEYIEGTSLRERLETGPLPEEQVLDFGLQLMEGLEAAHAQGVVHRDLKPENVQITDDGRLKILDFGIAKLIQSSDDDATTETMTAGLIGTVGYMSPEQLRGAAVDRRTDIYAAGAILYEMATGRARYADAHGADLISAVLNEEPASPRSVNAHVSEDLETVVLKSLAKDPLLRYQTAHALQDELERMVHGTKIAAKRSGKGSRRSLLSLGIVVAALILLELSGVRHRLMEGPAPGLRPNTVAIFPFRVSGGEDIQYLRAGMVDLLYPLLDGAGKLSSLEPARLLKLVGEREVDVEDPEVAREISAELGASLFVTGNLVAIGDQVRISAKFHDENGDVLQSTNVTATGQTELAAKVDELARNLLQGRVSAGEMSAGLDTNIDAMRAYLQGQVHYRAGRFEEAASSFEQAVEADSLFAYGWKQLASSYNFGAGGREDVLRALRKTLELGGGLSETAHAAAQAHYYAQTEVSRRADQLLREVLASHPDDPEAWFYLGDFILHFGGVLGDEHASAKRYMERAEELGYPDEHSLVGHLAWAELLANDIDGYLEKTKYLLEKEPDNDFANVFRLEIAIVEKDEAALETALAGLAAGDESMLEMAIANCVHALKGKEGLSAARRAAELLTHADRATTSRARGQLLLAHLDLADGKHESARGRIVRAFDLDPDQALPTLAYLEAAPFLEFDADEIRRLLKSVEEWVPKPQETSETDAGLFSERIAGLDVVREYLLGLLHAISGNHENAEIIAAGLDRPPFEEDVIEWEQALAHGIRAEIARHGSDWEAAARHAAWRPWKVFWATTHQSSMHALVREHYVRAQAHRQLGNLDEALRWFETVSFQAVEDIVFRAPAAYESGLILEELGRDEEAAAKYERFVEMWRDCDPKLQPRVEDATRRLAEIRRG